MVMWELIIWENIYYYRGICIRWPKTNNNFIYRL